MSVVGFPKSEAMTWVCDCGCSTFALLDNGEAECANCGEFVRGDDGGWYEHIADAPEYDGKEVPFRDVQGNGSVDFARRRITRMADDEDIVLAVLAREDGTVHAWFAAETDEQLEWAERRLDDARHLLLKRDNES